MLPPLYNTSLHNTTKGRSTEGRPRSLDLGHPRLPRERNTEASNPLRMWWVLSLEVSTARVGFVESMSSFYQVLHKVVQTDIN